jgi:hypothetical protein
LLHDGPGTGVRKKEIVMIELKAVLDRVVVDLCREAAEINQILGVVALERIFRRRP